MKFAFLDANVILRYLLRDHLEHSDRARALIERAYKDKTVLKVPSFILAEVVYVLEGKTYGYSRGEIYAALLQFSREPAIFLEEGPAVLQALLDYRDLGVDFADALLMAMARQEGSTVWTFNRSDFTRMAGDWEEP